MHLRYSSAPLVGDGEAKRDTIRGNSIEISLLFIYLFYGYGDSVSPALLLRKLGKRSTVPYFSLTL